MAAMQRMRGNGCAVGMWCILQLCTALLDLGEACRGVYGCHTPCLMLIFEMTHWFPWLAQDVAKTAVAIVKEAEGVSTAQAEAILKKVSDAGRIQKDVW